MNNTHQNFVKVEPDSQFYTDLSQLEASLKFGNDVISHDHILKGVQNTIKMGYQLLAPEPVLAVTDIVIYKTDGCGGVPIIAEIKAITPDDSSNSEKTLIYTLKNVHDGRLFSTVNRKRMVKWNNSLE